MDIEQSKAIKPVVEAPPVLELTRYRVKGTTEPIFNSLNSNVRVTIADLMEAPNAEKFVQDAVTMAAGELLYLWNKYKDQLEVVSGEGQ